MDRLREKEEEEEAAEYFLLAAPPFLWRCSHWEMLLFRVWVSPEEYASSGFFWEATVFHTLFLREGAARESGHFSSSPLYLAVIPSVFLHHFSEALERIPHISSSSFFTIVQAGVLAAPCDAVGSALKVARTIGKVFSSLRRCLLVSVLKVVRSSGRCARSFCRPFRHRKWYGPRKGSKFVEHVYFCPSLGTEGGTDCWKVYSSW